MIDDCNFFFKVASIGWTASISGVLSHIVNYCNVSGEIKLLLLLLLLNKGILIYFM